MTTNEKPTDGASSAKKESFGELLRKFALASVGAFVLAQEEVEEFVKRLVEKGDLAEKDARALIRDLLEKRRRVVTQGPAAPPESAVVPEVDRTIDKVLHKINVPTKNDLEELGKKIDEIEKKIEAFAKR